MDVIPELDTPLSSLRPGVLIETGRARFVAGGSVGNVGLALAALGADVRLISLAGQDELGDILVSILEKRGVAGGIGRTDRAPTAYTITLAPPGADRMFLHNPGLNDHIGPDDYDDGSIAGAELFHFGYPPLMRAFRANACEPLAELFRHVRSLGVATSLDLSLYGDGTEAAAVPWRAALAKLLPLSDFFVPSAEELCNMLDSARLDEWESRAPGEDVTKSLRLPDDVEPLADEALSMGARVVLVKCGEAGLFLKCADDMPPGLTRAFAGARIVQPVLPAPSPMVSSSGAGDMCAAAFLFAATRGYSPERCAWLGAAAGALCVTSYDGSDALCRLEDLPGKFGSGA